MISPSFGPSNFNQSKLRNDIRHADVLTYLVAAIEDDSLRQISIDN